MWFCLDIGHVICAANSFGIEPYTYIEKLLTFNPKRIHLSDIHIDSKFDEHLNYGQGNLDFSKVIGILPKDISITIETTKKSNINLNDYTVEANFLRSLIK